MCLPFSQEMGMNGAHLKCLYTNAHSMGNEQEVSEVCVQFQGYDLIGITETWWDSSHVLPWLDIGSLGRTGQDGINEDSPFR